MMKKILVIDDEPVVPHMISAGLKIAGVQHTLDYCSNGAQGRQKASQGGYDLITLDRNMPHVGGEKALEEIKRHPKSASIPIVIITAQRDLEFHKRATQLGAAAVLTKPFHPRQLGAQLAKILTGDQPESAS